MREQEREAGEEKEKLCVSCNKDVGCFFFLLLWSCLTFVSCVIESTESEYSGSGISVMLHSSLNPIKKQRGPNGWFYVFLCFAGWPNIGWGAAYREVKLSTQTHSYSSSPSGRTERLDVCLCLSGYLCLVSVAMFVCPHL